jgi:two-component system cell cycle response regulator
VTRPAVELAGTAGVRLGSPRDRRARLSSAPRPRALLVDAWAALLSDGGLVGTPARRRAWCFAVRSVPAAVAAASVGLLAARVYADAAFGLKHALSVGALLVALGAVSWRRAATARTGLPGTLRDDLELGSLLLLLAFTAAQATAVSSSGDPPLQAAVYLVLAGLVACLPRGAGLALVVFAVLVEAAIWFAGPGALEWPLVLAHFGFVLLFAVLYHALLGARVAAGRRAEEAAVERRKRELDDRARQLRLLVGTDSPADGDRAERAERLAEAAVLEADTAAQGLLQAAEMALRAHTVAIWLLTPDDAELRLWECRTQGEGIAERLPAGEGPLGGVVKRRAPVRLHGAIKLANHYRDGSQPQALMAMPLLARAGGYVRGVMVVDRMAPVPFGDEDEKLLATFVKEVARAVEAEGLIRDARLSRDETERFYGAIERLNRTAKPREVCDALLDVAAEMVRLDFGAVTLWEESEGKGRHRVARVTFGEPAAEADGSAAGPGDGAAAQLEGREFPDNGGLVACAVRLASSLPGRALRIEEAVIFDDATRLRGLLSLKVLPLKAGDAVLGTLVVGARAAGAYHGEAVRQLEVVAMQAGDALLRARLFEQTERLATTDGLTGLVNHRSFQTRLDEHIAAARRYGKKVSLLFTDIDHFKSVNDTYGHPAGDVVLRGVAAILHREARTTDVAARYGGEEFALVMPETDLAGALRTAERIRQKVGEAIFRTEQGELRITLSIGVAAFPDDAGNKADLVEAADGGLYHAKRHGRNQTVSLSALRGQKRTAGDGPRAR